MRFLDRIQPDSARRPEEPEPAATVDQAERAEARRLAAELLSELHEAFLVAGAEPRAFWQIVSVDEEPTHWGWFVDKLKSPKRGRARLGVTVEGDYFTCQPIDGHEVRLMARRRLGEPKDRDIMAYTLKLSGIEASLSAAGFWRVYYSVSLDDLVDELDGNPKVPDWRDRWDTSTLRLINGRPVLHFDSPRSGGQSGRPLEDLLVEAVNGYNPKFR